MKPVCRSRLRFSGGVDDRRKFGRVLREVGRCNRSELAADWHTLLTAICAPMKSSASPMDVISLSARWGRPQG